MPLSRTETPGQGPRQSATPACCAVGSVETHEIGQCPSRVQILLPTAHLRGRSHLPYCRQSAAKFDRRPCTRPIEALASILPSSQRLNSSQWSSGPSEFPIGHQLDSPQLYPFDHCLSHPARKSTGHDTPGFDLDPNLMLPVSSVYVRWIMVAVVHENGDAEESADFWHVDTPTIQSMQSSLTHRWLNAGRTSHASADDGSDRQ